MHRSTNKMFEDSIERPKRNILTIVLLLHIFCVQLWARPATVKEAEKIVKGWLKSNSQPLGTPIGWQIAAVETFTNETDEPIYYIVYLQPSGFVIVSSDDLLEPIIGFSEDGIYDPSPQNPLGALVTQDLKGRLAKVKADQNPQKEIGYLTLSDAQSKWYNLITVAEVSKDNISSLSLSKTSDIRVAPLIQSKWAQTDVCNKNCFNYYIPNYPCGCVATAMAQLMRYHRHPTAGIGKHSFTFKIDGRPRRAETLGGDGLGGAYNWDNMVLIPDCTISNIQLQAIGALCYDAGISVEMEYTADGSSADALIGADVLTTIFQYSNAVKGFNKGNNIGSGLTGMINPNLDAGFPVILGIWREQGGHAVICDGYGQNSSTLYHHLNMGWAGSYDAWYNLPNIDAQTMYTSVISCLYNIFVSGTGEIISGRVTDKSGNPISGAIVTAKSTSRGRYETTTNLNGIYALAKIPSASNYTISVIKPGYTFIDQNVTTGTSNDGTKTSGNKWQIDFTSTLAGDFDSDGDVDASDLVVFTSAWLTESENAGWNPSCNVGRPTDNFIDSLDFAEFANSWHLDVQ
ncbi:MAG: C10 family peptidase [Sedimentisphaerales bacterium]|nr:C10 family peptidase [Sedimentisphaerales bacterium]